MVENRKLAKISELHRPIRLDEIREHASNVDNQRAEAHDKRRQQRLSSHLHIPQYNVNIASYKDRLEKVAMYSPA